MHLKSIPTELMKINMMGLYVSFFSGRFRYLQAVTTEGAWNEGCRGCGEWAMVMGQVTHIYIFIIYIYITIFHR